VLAPAEIVALHPDVIRSPLEGVVDAVKVEPNANVRRGDLLFTLDRTALESRRSVAESSLAATQADLRQTTLLAVSEAKSQARLAILSGQIDEQQSELDFVNDLLARSEVRATRTGVALFDDASEWIGKPVALGERVMSIADAHDTEIEAWLSVADAIELPKDASVTVYLNATPLAPVRATLRLLGYEPQLRPEGVMAYRVRAKLQQGSKAPRVGLKGTAKIAGARVPLIYWVFRRPIAAVRQFFGW
jgi:multidrug efflux pump subunit AcrA (membrane-fusion protein)